MIAYILAGSFGLSAIFGGWAYYERQARKGLEYELTVTEIKLSGCTARLTNMIEDKESDDEIDRIPDDALRNAPPGWMLPPLGSGSVY